MPNFCDNCHQKGGTNSIAFNMILCSHCKYSEQYKMMYKTTAKTYYFLTENDIQSIDTFDGPRIRQKTTTLVRKSDVKDIFCQKYQISPSKIDERLKELSKLKNIRQERAAERKNMTIQKRKAELIQALAKYRLQLRNDSKLCQKYIDNTINHQSRSVPLHRNWTLDQVVERMCQMHFLYNYANMDRCLEKAKSQQEEELEAGYFPDISIFEEAEMLALEATNGYPDNWPWLENEVCRESDAGCDEVYSD